MGIRLVLGSATLPVEPGQSIAGDVRVVNDGPDEVQLDLAISGAARPYSWVAPDSLTVPGGGEAAARLGFRLPRASTPPAGPLEFEVTAQSRQPDGPDPTTAAGVVEVLPFAVLSVALAPASADGDDSKGATVRHELTVGNRGNAPMPTELRVTADDDDLDVTIEPSSLIVPPAAESSVTATVRVAPKAPTRGAGERVSTFRVTVQPQVGEPMEVTGKFHSEPAGFSKRRLMVGAIVAAVALIAGAIVLTSGGSSTKTTSASDVAAATNAPLDACPAKGHTDQFGVRSIQPNDIANLPKTYTFLHVAADGCTPVRFNPCQPIHFIQNAAAAPPFAADNVREAFRRLGVATGMTFIDDGLTTETTRDAPYVPALYGSRWAPILIFWDHFPADQTTGASQVLGNTNQMKIGDVVVSGRLRFNVDAYNNEITKAPISAGFGPSSGSGTGAIGRDNIQWGRILLHELAHVVGLGHTSDFSSLMYPDAAQQNSRPADFNRVDLAGLRYLGTQAGCLTEPTPGAS